MNAHMHTHVSEQLHAKSYVMNGTRIKKILHRDDARRVDAPSVDPLLQPSQIQGLHGHSEPSHQPQGSSLTDW